jgi:uncharacterized membrane protein
MAKVKRSITVNTRVEKVYSYLRDPENQLEWLPSVTDIQDVQGYGVGQRFRRTYKMIGLSLKGEGEVIEDIINERCVVKTTGGILSTWVWTFKPEDFRTHLNLIVDYTIPVPVLGKVGEWLVSRQNEREADLAMANLKDRLES